MIEQDLARIASALEQIAQVMARPPQVMAGGSPLALDTRACLRDAEEAPAAKPLPTDIDAQAAQAGNADDADHLKREQIKADLRLLGVAFKDSARTSTLMKMLDDKLASAAPKDTPPEASGTPENKASETDEPENEAPATRDEARMALVELSAAKGKDAALATLHKVGGAEKLSDVAEERYAAIVKACKERCDG